MSRVLRPGRLSTVIRVTFDPSGFEVLLGMSNPGKKKSSTLTRFGSLQNFPLTNTVVRKVCYVHMCMGQFYNNV